MDLTNIDVKNIIELSIIIKHNCIKHDCIKSLKCLYMEKVMNMGVGFMGRINLVIADKDEAYIENIVNYLMVNHSRKFQVSSFTQKHLLYEFLNQSTNKVDILLVCPEFCSESMPKENVTSVVLLSTGMVPKELEGYTVIAKYQHGGKLTSNIINIFSENCDDIVISSPGDKNTKVVAVYSPVGGAGKTTIAACSAIQSAKEGLQAFYLNLEGLQSTPFFLNCKSEQSFSSILYYLKEKNINLHLKIEGTRIVDTESNVHYFPAIDSMFDFEDVEPNELIKLISEFRSMGQYDIVFVDMTSDLNDRNLALLESCDEIILVLPQDAISCIKAELFEKELEIIAKRKNLDLSGKITVVLNKYNSHMALEIDTISVSGKSISYYIPMVPGMVSVSIRGNAHFMDVFTEFCEGIHELIGKYR